MRSPFYESALEKQGVAFEYVERFSLEDIDAQKSLRNQARLEDPVDQELVAQYAQAYKENEQFPPLVIWKPARGRHVLVDGNQRFAALRKVDRKVHDVYVVGCVDELVIDRLTWSWNNLVNGKRLSPEETLRHAVTLVRKYGTTAHAAAKEFRLPPWKVQKAVRVEDMREILQKRGMPNHLNLTDDVLDDLAPLKPLGEDFIAQAATVAAANGLTNKEVGMIVKAVTSAKTTEEKVAALQTAATSSEVAARRAETKGGAVRSKTTPRRRFASLLLQLRRLVEDYDKAVRPPSGKEYEECREVVSDVVDRLVNIFGLGARRQAQ